MLNINKLSLFIIGVVLFQHSYSQTCEYPTDYFRSPMDIPLYLSGNFGELRSNHFHTGLDIKTQGVEGKNIYAIADGYVSRINVSHWGYGLALYITHPNGYTSVYAHLSKFNKEITAFLRKGQKFKESETITLYPGPGQIKVNKGDVVALSGNSGSSGGPHLHFEIRETKTEHPVNPLLFGFKIKDNIAPKIYTIRAYPITTNSTITGAKNAKTYSLSQSGNTYTLDETIEFTDSVGLAVRTIDMLNGSGNHCGIFRIELYLDEKKIFEQEMEKLDFNTNRYINCHMDYLAYKENKQSYHKNFCIPSNELPIYKTKVNNGIIGLPDNEVHNIKWIVTDSHGNTSIIKGNIQRKRDLDRPNNQNNATRYKVAKWNEPFLYQNDDIKLLLPEKTLYENLPFLVKKVDQQQNGFPVYQVMDYDTPAHRRYLLSFRVPDSLIKYADKMLIVSFSENGNGIYNERGTFDGIYLTTRTRSFGKYSVMIDSTPPVISVKNESLNISSNTSNLFTYVVTDNLSGLTDYDVYVDNEWQFSSYSYRTGKLNFSLNELSVGQHKMVIIVKDERNNETRIERTLNVQ